MKKTFAFIFILLILFSCNQTEKKITPNIEIFLTKNRIQSYQGIKLEYPNFDSITISHHKNRWGQKPIRIDTIKNELILAGAFKSEITDLQSEPFITSDQIISLDKKNGELYLNKIATKKLSELKSDSFGQQFVLTIDGKPEVNGYFLPAAFAFGSNTYHYVYSPNNEISLLEFFYGLELRYINLETEFPNLFKIID